MRILSAGALSAVLALSTVAGAYDTPKKPSTSTDKTTTKSSQANGSKTDTKAPVSKGSSKIDSKKPATK